MRRRPWIWIVGGTLVLILGGLGLYLSQQIGDKDWWRREAETYNQKHSIPDDENSAPILRNMELPCSTVIYQDWKSPIDQLDLENWSKVNGHTGDMLRASRMRYFVPLNPDNVLCNSGRWKQLPLKISDAANSLVLAARVQASEGHPEDALAFLFAAIRMGSQADRGCYIDREIGAGARSEACEAMQRLAMDTPPPPEALEHATAELEELSRTLAPPEEAWEVDHMIKRGWLERYYRPASWRELLGADNKLHLNWLRMAFDHPLGRCRQELEETYRIYKISSPSQNDRERLTELSGCSRFGRDVFWSDLPGERLTQDLRQEQGTRLLLLLRAYRLRHGAYPESLSTLAAFPGFPTDAGRFTYRRLEGDTFQLEIPVQRHSGKRSWIWTLRFGKPPEPPRKPKKNPVASPSPAP